MGTFHADTLGQFPHAASDFLQLVLKIDFLKLFARLTQRQIQWQGGAGFAGITGIRDVLQYILHFIDINHRALAQNEQTLHQVFQFTIVPRPAVIAQTIL